MGPSLDYSCKPPITKPFDCSANKGIAIAKVEEAEWLIIEVGKLYFL